LHLSKKSFSHGYAKVTFIPLVSIAVTTDMNLSIKNMLRLLLNNFNEACSIDLPLPSISSICRCRSKAIMA